MKKIRNKLVITFAFLLIQASFLQAQVISKRASVTLVQSDWQPVNVFENPRKQSQQGTEITIKPALINEYNGVSIYSKVADCGNSLEETSLIKVINVNPNPVKISWKRSAESPVEFVIIPASKEVMGTCGSPESKLVITLPKDEKEREKIVNYMLSHLTVNNEK